MALKHAVITESLNVKKIFKELFEKFRHGGEVASPGQFTIESASFFVLSDEQVLFISPFYSCIARYNIKENSMVYFLGNDFTFMSAVKNMGFDPYNFGIDKKKTLLLFADHIEAAAEDKVDLPATDFQTVMGIDIPQQYKSKSDKYGMLKLSSGWESYMAIAYEMIGSEPHPGSQARGSGFRSTQYGRAVAALVRKRASQYDAEPTVEG